MRIDLFHTMVLWVVDDEGDFLLAKLCELQNLLDKSLLPLVLLDGPLPHLFVHISFRWHFML